MSPPCMWAGTRPPQVYVAVSPMPAPCGQCCHWFCSGGGVMGPGWQEMRAGTATEPGDTVPNSWIHPCPPCREKGQPEPCCSGSFSGSDPQGRWGDVAGRIHEDDVMLLPCFPQVPYPTQGDLGGSGLRQSHSGPQSRSRVGWPPGCGCPLSLGQRWGR